jgi:hypothetical protein
LDIACATKGDVTPVGEKSCEILRQFTGPSSRITNGKVRTEPILFPFLREWYSCDLLIP